MNSARSLGIALLLVFGTGPVWAQVASQPSDADRPLVEACAHELGERQGGGHAFTVTAMETERPNEATVRVKLALTSGEGRLIQGTCVFRNGKLFDVRQ
jgi:hypothetical protein